MRIFTIVVGDAVGGRWKVVQYYAQVLTGRDHSVTPVIHTRKRKGRKTD